MAQVWTKESFQKAKEKADEDASDQKEEIKEEGVEEEAPLAASSEDLEAIRKELEEERKKREAIESQYKNVSGMLTRTQQDYSELLKFQKAILPKVNKSFEESWNEDPKSAVEETFEEIKTETKKDLGKIDQKLAYVNAITWMNEVVAEDPAKAKYIKKVKELGTTMYGNLTFSEEGIRELFDLAEAKEKMKTQPQHEETNKTRTFTESSGGANAQRIVSKKPLPRAALNIIRGLGIKEEDYRKHMDNGTANPRSESGD